MEKTNDVNELDEKVKVEGEESEAAEKEEKVDVEEPETTDKEDKEDKVDADQSVRNILGDEIKIETPYIDASVEKHKKKKKVVKGVVATLAILAGATYVGGAVYFKNHFDDDTFINGIDVSGKSIEEVKNIIKEDQMKYSLNVEFKNSTEEINCNQAGIEITSLTSIENIKSNQNFYSWPFNFGNHDEYSVDYQLAYSEEDLKKLVYTYSAMDDSKMKEPVNAEVVIKDGEVSIKEDETGTKLDKQKVVDAIGEALVNFDESVNIVDKDCYIEAHVTKDSPVIQTAYKEANAFINMQASYDFAGYEMPIPKEELGKMISINSSGHIELSKEKVEDYAMRFAKKYTTCYTDRKFETHDGKIIDVYGGYYGWDIDGETEAVELYDHLQSGRDFIKEPACNKVGYAMGDMNDIGDNYVEIDLSDQMVYVFSDGVEIFSTPCVSGNVSWGMSTPGGLFGLSYRERNATLRGATYETKVAYWMPFNGDIGMHDATWKSKFGGEIYKTDGSHGCINLPLDSAAFIFDYVEHGSPVVCYWED